MLRATKPDEKIFSELKEIKDMKFRFQGRCYYYLYVFCILLKTYSFISKSKNLSLLCLR